MGGRFATRDASMMGRGLISERFTFFDDFCVYAFDKLCLS